jgi:penicillin-binding protein 1A
MDAAEPSSGSLNTHNVRKFPFSPMASLKIDVDRIWVIPAWVLGGTLALALGVVVGFQIYAPQVVKQFRGVVMDTSNNTLIYDGNDNLIANIEGTEDRHSIPITRIHPYLQKAVVAIEDRRFFAHRGMDPVRLLGALWADIKAMGYKQGASTITQQLVKLSLLSSEKKISRKIREIFMAIALEQKFPKLKLLELYLNRVYLGNGVYGVEKASKAYFGKSASDLTLNEAAFLAALIRKPEGYLIFPDHERYQSEPAYPLHLMTALMKRQRLVLRTLAELGWISREELEEGLAQGLAVKRPKSDIRTAPYFVQQVMKELRENLGIQRVSGRGYRVYTTLDMHMQEVAERKLVTIRKNEEGTRHASLIAMDPFTGYVRALVGGVSFSESEFNRATQANRQPGSAIKPILYAGALERGIRPHEVFVDEPVSYSWDEMGNYLRLYERDQAADLALGLDVADPDSFYTPRNYNDRYGLLRFSGGGAPVSDDRRMTLARAFELSSNVIAVQLLDRLGMEKFVETSNRWNLPLRVENGLCVALGCSEVTLAELTTAYAAFANGGLRIRPVYIRKVTNSDEDLLFEHLPEPPVEVISPWTAFQLRHLLAGAVQRGTGRRARINRPMGGKTGTNDGPRDTWFIGFTPNLVTGTWMGHDDNEVMPGEAGGLTTAALWRDFMEEALPPYNGEAFPEPPDEYVGVRICNLDGQLEYEGCPDVSLHYFREAEFTQDLFAQNISGIISAPSRDSVRPLPGQVTQAPANQGAPTLFSRSLRDSFRPLPLPDDTAPDRESSLGITP